MSSLHQTQKTDNEIQKTGNETQKTNRERQKTECKNQKTGFFSNFPFTVRFFVYFSGRKKRYKDSKFY